MQINRDLYRNKLVHAIGNIVSELHGLTHKSFDGCESDITQYYIKAEPVK